MRDVEFSASRENIRSKWLMQRFCRRSSKRGLAEQTASSLTRCSRAFGDETVFRKSSIAVQLPPYSNCHRIKYLLLEKPLLRTKCQTFVGAIPSHESCRIRGEHWPC